MPEDEAKYHLKRCVDSGLWVPDASKVEKDAATAEEPSDKASASTSTSSASDPKPNISTEEVD